MSDTVILVDDSDRQTGTAGKIDAHRKALLHRAFSIFILDSGGNLLLQRRADDKYHSGGLWANTCCSHAIEFLPIDTAAHRRLLEEMGFDCRLRELFTLHYKAECGNGLVEHEMDHIFTGTCDAAPVPDPSEVAGWRWSSLEAIGEELKASPESFTCWFRIIFPEFVRSVSPETAR